MTRRIIGAGGTLGKELVLVMNTELKDKVVLVTGASGGIGSEAVRKLAAEGAKVAIHYRGNRTSAEELAKGLQGRSVLVSGDVGEERDVEKIFAEVEKSLGPVDVLVANAGIWEERYTPLHEMSLTQWNRTLQVNLTSMFLCLREFIRGIKKGGIQNPSAVLVGSTAAIFGEAGHADYAASKAAAVYGLMLSMKNEMARVSPRARINAVCPSWVLTPMADSLMENSEAVKKVLQTVPLRKLGMPSDVASSILFLASSALSGHMSGQIITLAGGMEGRVLYERSEIDLK